MRNIVTSVWPLSAAVKRAEQKAHTSRSILCFWCDSWYPKWIKIFFSKKQQKRNINEEAQTKKDISKQRVCCQYRQSACRSVIARAREWKLCV